MHFFPIIYLKDGKAIQPAGARPIWFSTNPLTLAKEFARQGAHGLILLDLNIQATGKSPNYEAIQMIQKEAQHGIWVSGNFRTLESIDLYAKLGVDKIILGGAAYQITNFVKDAVQRFFKKISVKIEMINGHVVIPGLIAPTHKSVIEYAQRFKEEGVPHLCYADSNTNGWMEGQNFESLKEFCRQIKLPILCLSDVQKMEDFKFLFECEKFGLMGAALGKSLYENRIDIHASKAFLDDVAAGSALESSL